jgi:hypothetical protein
MKRRNKDNYALGELATQTEELESTVVSEAGEWLDASGVQKFSQQILTLNKGRNMKRRNKT